ncbi:MAG: TIGR02391 family protein [Candidatus Thorarchaeota archaeon]|nr:TIGR02391 family protein [Candidatus Thorarchaeota archaeon]
MRGLVEDRYTQYRKALKSRETALAAIIKTHEKLEDEEPLEERELVLPIELFDAMRFHPKVIEASRDLFEDGHYRDAILRAFIEVNNFVKAKTRLELDNRDLMSKVFRLGNPVIKLNELKTQSEKDEQEGFMFLFMGAMVGIRNPKAHDNIVQSDPLRALEYLALASLLIKRAEEGVCQTE